MLFINIELLKNMYIVLIFFEGKYLDSIPIDY